MQILSPLRVRVDSREKQILRVLSDKHCLAILSITKEDALTVSMICSCCNMSTSTAYRKLDLLQKLNFLRVRYTILSNGKKSTSFQCKITGINILLSENQLQIHTNFVPIER